jgi:5-formyltetrahydrofolate cyclo-ligase
MGGGDGVEDTAAEKERLRAELTRARAARPQAERDVDRAALRDLVLDGLAGADCVAAYEPLRTEPGSTELLAALHGRGVRVLVPVTMPDRDLDWAQWTADGVGPMLGRVAIAAAGLALVPALAVAADGTRLGRGGGSYDRALARCAPGARLVALLFDGELVARLPRDPWDRPVSEVVTPAGWARVGRNTEVADYS